MHVSLSENSFITAASTLKLWVVNHSYLKKLKEVKVLGHWSTYKFSEVQTYFWCFVDKGNFLSVRPADQRPRSVEVRFYSRCYIMKSRVNALARKIKLAIAVSVDPSIIFYSLDPMVSTKYFTLFRFSFSVLKSIFHF